MRRRLHPAVMLIAMLPGLGLEAHELSEQRWEDPSFGLTFLPPEDVRVLENTTDGARVKFVNQDFDLSLYIEKTGVNTEVQAIKSAASLKLAYPYPDMVELEDAAMRVGDRPGWRIYHVVPHEEHGDFVIGQAFIKIDPTTFAVLQFQCDNKDYERVGTMFQAVLDSVAFIPATEMDRRRTAMLEATEAWKKGIGFDGLRAAMIPEQWFRIVEGDRDIGYMRMTQRESTRLGQDGIEVQIRLRVNEGGVLLDQKRDFFLAENGTTEVWSIRGTRRVAGAEHALPDAVGTRAVESWAETGLAADGLLTVDQKSETGVDRDEWSLRPPDREQQKNFAYLSQIETLLMPRHLPGDVATAYGFYAYYSNTHTISLWTRRVEPLANGAYLVVERPSPEVGERRLTFGPDGRLLRFEAADGRVLLAVTREQIKKLYDIE